MDPLAQAYKEKKKWEESMGIGTLDKLCAVLSGEKPDYNDLDYLGVPKSEDQHLNFDSVFEAVVGEFSPEIIKTAQVIKEATPNQLKAIQKYPSLIDILGQDDSDELSNVIGEVMNNYIISKIHKNSSLINKNAIDCKQDGEFIKQYFKYSDIVGFVKVAGSFSGNEYIHYDKIKNQALVLNKKAGNQFENVSQNYQIASEFVALK